MKSYLNWRLQQKEHVLWLYFDKENSSSNNLDENVLTELSAIIQEISNDKSVQGLIITSNKVNGFIVGANIQAISKLKTKEEILTFIQLGQKVFDELAALNISTVALINGLCLGGGLELALACDYRIAVADDKTRLGLPEVLLGIHPGWGGTIRLPRLLGGPSALELILTGKTISPYKALKLGLIDQLVPLRQAERAALFYASAKIKKKNSFFAINWKKITNYHWMRNIISKIVQRRLSVKVNPKHYPAPYAALHLWKQYGVNNQAFLHEAISLSELALTPTAKNLMRVFFLKERLKKFGKKNNICFKHVHVIGAGTMGGDIAAWCALQGLYVTLQDREAKYIAPAMTRAYALFQKRLKTPRAIQAAMDRLVPDLAGYGIHRADIIIEAIFEDLIVKQDLFRQLENQIKSETLLASNTSSIVLEDIQQGLRHPERLISLHFFNPVAKMPLVEVVQSAITAPDVIEKGLAFVRQINRLPLPVKSSPGFLVNRLLMPYLMQSVLLLQTGIPAPVIDKAAVDFGMPMGPLELADTVGLDICLAVAKILSESLGSIIPEGLEKMVANKDLGRKTEKGFYRYKKGKPIKEKIPEDYKAPTNLTDSLIQPMIDEAKKCLEEKVVADSDLIDAGIIFGAGFAPFRGGLMQYAKEQGDL
ncbi:3-hydroxyacyl-CoA dehydrogenase NAD-binding domain-containing protein [Rickettsiella endosymbiont of Xylota segnis]|uniref:3-hydroxyacyl-CoA dehydrogenase NAD-binding domain-containing protein n=1 Tax=Rickettsiella endosymbiont of Xylota segnis TaxID=3066238 RepID=UPI0030CD48D4